MIANTTSHDSCPSVTRQQPAGAGAVTLTAKITYAVAWLGLVARVARERRLLRRLTAEQRQDLGVTADAVSRESGRALFDLPQRRLDDVQRRLRRVACTR